MEMNEWDAKNRAEDLNMKLETIRSRILSIREPYTLSHAGKVLPFLDSLLLLEEAIGKMQDTICTGVVKATGNDVFAPSGDSAVINMLTDAMGSDYLDYVRYQYRSVNPEGRKKKVGLGLLPWAYYWSILNEDVNRIRETTGSVLDFAMNTFGEDDVEIIRRCRDGINRSFMEVALATNKAALEDLGMIGTSKSLLSDGCKAPTGNIIESIVELGAKWGQSQTKD